MGPMGDEEQHVERKKPSRKAEPGPKRRIAWPRWTGFRGMTVRDWLQLLIVPFALVVIGFLFTAQQDRRQQQIEDQRAQQAQKIENQRAEAERELAEQRAQDEALQAYLDQMNNLLLEHNLRNSEEDSEVRTLARARTITVLERLDPSRKTQIMQFLREADMLNRVDEQDNSVDETGPIILLQNANLRDANLTLFNLGGAGLGAADLSGASLFGANLNAAALPFANLIGTDLRLVDLTDADLRSADLTDADLRRADLSGANMAGATGITNEALEQQASSLQGATMPNGQKYEDWLKSREEDGGG
jgi:uncharacterized protein YjbI with pentapeptide repeats